MSSMTVYQLDSDGFLMGETTADESPLEPGVYLIPAGAITEPPPAGVTGRLRWQNGGWAVVADRLHPEVSAAEELQRAKAELIAQAERIAAASLATIPWDFGGEHGVQHFQIRDEDDKIAWLTLWQSANALIAAGETRPVLLIRTQENNNISVTPEFAAGAMAGLADYGATVRQALWAHKDRIAALADLPAVQAYEVTAGW